MSTKENFAASLIKQPVVIAIVLIVVAVVVILINEKPGSSDTSALSATKSESQSSPGSSNAEMQLKPQGPGQDTPRIMANMNQQQEGSVSAPGLENLVKGLEDKVAADPTNVNNRLLLAQTYNELGMQDKALTEMRSLQKENPDNGRINLILGSILSNSSDQEKVKESLALLDKASGDKTIQQYLVHMYRGDALIRMQDHQGALEQWKLALQDMPPADNRRARLEQRIRELSVMDNKNAESQGGKG
ncbi:tetratricopeptide repeat protein [Kaarinaea lacus]